MRGPAVLALRDGSLFRGEAGGADANPSGAGGEVVFNTSLAGYQEILTDPSYAGQIISFTYPHIGNYGVNSADSESHRIFASGAVVRDLARRPSSWRSEETLEELLIRDGIPVITGIDTRRLTRLIRSEGAMAGVIIHGEVGDAEAREFARAVPSIEGADLASSVTCDAKYVVEPDGAAAFDVAALDFGIKRRIVDDLVGRGARVTVWPATTSADVLIASGPDAVFLSNGPGDPAAVTYARQSVNALLGKVPIFGICLGHQIAGLALGGNTFKLPFGHHGGNHPVKHLVTGRVEVTAQNHGFALDPSSLGGIPAQGLPWGPEPAAQPLLTSDEFGEIEITHVNLNDGTVEGIRCREIPAFSVQYHPEAAPGPHDAAYLFDEFKKMVESCR